MVTVLFFTRPQSWVRPRAIFAASLALLATPLYFYHDHLIRCVHLSIVSATQLPYDVDEAV